MVFLVHTTMDLTTKTKITIRNTEICLINWYQSRCQCKPYLKR